MDTTLKTLGANIGNKALLLRGLPATGFTKNNLDWTSKCFFELSGVPLDHISSISNHIINTETSSSSEWTNIRHFDYIVGERTNFISNSDLFQDIFLDMGSYTNNEPMHLSLVCTCLTDVTCWQFTIVFKRWPRDKSQLQIHNTGKAVPLLY